MSRRRHYQNITTQDNEYAKPTRQGRKSRNDRGKTKDTLYLDDSSFDDNQENNKQDNSQDISYAW